MYPPVPVEIPDRGLREDWDAWWACTERERQRWLSRRISVIQARRRMNEFDEDNAKGVDLSDPTPGATTESAP
jgi:hypothetical protein